MAVQEISLSAAPARPGGAQRPRLRGSARRLLATAQLWVLPGSLLALWEIIAITRLLPVYIFPAPGAVLQELWSLAASGALFHHLWVSSTRVASGFAIGAGAATILGALTGHSALWHRIFDSTLQALRSIPIIAWVPLFILWLGIAEASKIALIALGAFFPVYLNLMSGVAGVDRKLIEVGRANRMSGLRLVVKVLLPASLPAYVVGLRAGLGLAWMFVAAAELMGASEGIGYLLLNGQSIGRPALIIACMLVFAAIGKASDLAVAFLGRSLLRWQDTARAQ
jgi:sulfonate transport system permease protein